MNLCIAEKPSVAKEIARILGANTRKDGYFEGNGYFVSWTFGHLCTLKAPDDYTDIWKTWQLNTLPIIPPQFGIKIIDDPGIKKQFKTIEWLVTKSTQIINCGDAGIEGELIQRWVLLKAKNNKPLKRLWISSLTDEAIKEGFENLAEGSKYNNLYAAGNARAIGDWLLGMNASRVYTLKYANGKGVLSIGRVQTPTLALIVNRYIEISNFKPEPFWELKTLYRNVIFNATKGRFLTVDDANNALETITGKPFTITSFNKKEAKEQPPKLFDLTSLQIECNKKFGFTADETLQIIQKLYETKLVTYPRVDTTYLPNDIYPKIKTILEKLTPYQNIIKPLLTEKIRKNKKITDHHAIIPTGVYPSGLILNHKKVYDIITKRFISAFYPDCTVMNSTVTGEVEKIEFKATGKIIIKPGWRDVYAIADKQTDNDNEHAEQTDTESQIMPEFIVGEQGPHSPGVTQKTTQPPKQFTEATLLRAMETAGKNIDDDELREVMKENGIGRPSTRANIIETLFKRKFIYRDKKNLLPTTTGIQLIQTINNELLKSVELTGLWEKKLRQIENGKYEANLFLDEMKQMVTNLVNEVITETSKTINIIVDNNNKPDNKEATNTKNKKKTTKNTANQTQIEGLTCPKCNNGKLIKGKNAYGCSMYKNGCNFVIPFNINGITLNNKQVNDIINKGKTQKIAGFINDNNNKYDGYIKLNNDKTIVIEPVEKHVKTNTKPVDKQNRDEQKLICPSCNKGILLKGKNAYGCSNYNKGCNFIIPFANLEFRFGTTDLNNEILNNYIRQK